MRACSAPVVAVLALAVLGPCGLPTASSASTGTASTGVREDGGTAYADVDGCGQTDRLCLAFPNNCYLHKNCTLMITARPDSGKYLFEMSAQYTGYVAVALADSTSMGVDSVIECIMDPKNHTVLQYQSVNKALNTTTGKRGNSRLPAEAQQGVQLVRGAVKDGVISCVVSRDPVTTVAGKEYNLANGSWVLQGAAGNRINSDTSIHHHTEWVVSPTHEKLSNTGVIPGSYGKRRDSPPSGNNSAGTPKVGTELTLLLAGFVFYIMC